MIERLVARARQLLTVPLSERAAGFRRDMAMLLGPLRGERPSPTTPRAPSHRPLDLASRSRRLRVAEVIRETPSAVTLRFAQPVGAPLSWEAGQFLTLVVPSPSGPLRRAYSISVPPWRGTPTDPCVTIKRVDGGRVSNQLVEHAAAGQWYEVRGPSGQFTYRSQGAARVVLIGGGSGVTPLVSILEEALRDPAARVLFLDANLRSEEIIFRDRLARLAQNYPDRLEIRHFLDEDGGRLDGARLAGEISRELDGAVVYSCGPEGLMALVRETLGTLGHLDELREERFASPGVQRPRALPSAAQAVIFEAERRREVMVNPGETLLEAGLRAGVPMAFSCTMGGCGACRVKVREGEVMHDEPNGLSASERDARQAFACIARPLGPCTIEVSK